jgi:hypothetical protein
MLATRLFELELELEPEPDDEDEDGDAATLRDADANAGAGDGDEVPTPVLTLTDTVRGVDEEDEEAGTVARGAEVRSRMDAIMLRSEANSAGGKRQRWRLI